MSFSLPQGGGVSDFASRVCEVEYRLSTAALSAAALSALSAALRRDERLDPSGRSRYSAAAAHALEAEAAHRVCEQAAAGAHHRDARARRRDGDRAGDQLPEGDHAGVSRHVRRRNFLRRAQFCAEITSFTTAAGTRTATASRSRARRRRSRSARPGRSRWRSRCSTTASPSS